MRVAGQPNPDSDLGLMLYDVFDLDVMHEPGKVAKPKARISFFPARLSGGVMNVPDWSEIKRQLGDRV